MQLVGVDELALSYSDIGVIKSFITVKSVLERQDRGKPIFYIGTVTTVTIKEVE